MRRLHQVDVFGSDAGDGNALAVVHDATDLDADTMQRFAAWTNLSETTFLLSPTSADADYRVRIFTPGGELPFAGHPTLGSAHAWLTAGGAPRGEHIVQECAAGLIELRRDGERLGFAAPPLRRSGPLDDDTLAAVLAALRIDRDDIVDHAFTDNGPGWATVLLADARQVLALTPGDIGDLDIGVVGLHDDGTPELRAFFSSGGSGLTEDPVTGSLNAGVAQWLLGCGRLSAPYVARQGTALGRGGRVHVDQDADGTVWVAGATRTVIAGTVDLEPRA